jgi:hypothetical protein
MVGNSQRKAEQIDDRADQPLGLAQSEPERGSATVVVES